MNGEMTLTEIVISLVASLSAVTLSNVCKKLYVRSTAEGKASACLYSAVNSIVAAVVLLVWGGFGNVSPFTVLLGILFGCVTAVQVTVNNLALQVGPISYTTVIVSFSTLISAISGVLFFEEHMATSQGIGIALMLVSFVLAVEKKGDEKKASIKWLILSISCFLLTGGIGIMQKVHQSSQFKAELNGFLIIAFVVSFVASLTFSAIFTFTEKKAPIDKKAARKSFITAIIALCISGIFVAANNKLNLKLSGVMDSAVFFPLVNGGTLILTTLAALIVFRERLSKKQWIGIAAGIASVLFLCVKF